MPQPRSNKRVNSDRLKAAGDVEKKTQSINYIYQENYYVKSISSIVEDSG